MQKRCSEYNKDWLPPTLHTDLIVKRSVESLQRRGSREMKKSKF